MKDFYFQFLYKVSADYHSHSNNGEKTSKFQIA